MCCSPTHANGRAFAINGAIASGVGQRDAGTAAANTAMQAGSSLGVALVNTIAVIATRAALRADPDPAAALVHGYAVAAAAAAAVLLAVALLAAACLRNPQVQRHDAAAAHD